VILSKIMTGFLACLAAATAFGDSDLQKLVEANNGFAFDLLKQIAREQPTQNIFLSPFSVSTGLQMLGNGSAGNTKSEIQSVLKTESLPQDKLNAVSKGLNRFIKSQTAVTLDLANGIWYQNHFHLKPDFRTANTNLFGAELAPVDFGSPKSANIINDWAGKETRGKIGGIVSFPFPPLTRVVLANAIYFKGKWDEPFDKHLTKPRDFYPVSGGQKQTPMMSQHKNFSYQENGDFQAVRLPYAGNGLAMYLFLPAKNSSPRKLLDNLSGKKGNENIIQQFTDREGTVIFPKFKFDYDILLNQPLQALGMRQAFSDRSADFSAMADEPLFVSEVKQKSFVDVNEEGTEAAAVTEMEMSGGIEMEPPKPFEMVVNRPFLFVIADDYIPIENDNPSQVILFIGIVNEPTP
jgi:serpin B